MDVKKTVVDHFAGDFSTFYRRYLPDLPTDRDTVQICCPFHDDQQPSLSVNLRGEHAGSWRCFGACNSGGSFLDFYARKNGLDCRKQFKAVLEGVAREFSVPLPANGNGRAKPTEPQKHVRTLAERGISERTAQRFGILEKPGDYQVTTRLVFPVTGPDGQIVGEKTHKAGNAKAPPIQLYSWNALKEDGPVYLVNGEPSVWRAYEAGYRNVLACTGGEGNFKPEWADLFTKKTVRIVYDHDEAGWRGTDRTAGILHGKAASVEVVVWPEGTPKNFDAEDSLNAGHRLEDLTFRTWEPTTRSGGSVAGLTRLLRVAPPYGGEQQQQRQLSRASVSKLRANYIPTRWLIEGIMPVGGVGLIGGGPGIGKTWTVLDAALATATGGRWLNRFGCEQGRVLLILEEEDPGSVLERLDLLYAGRGLTQEAGDALPVELLIGQGVQIVDAKGSLDAMLEAQVRDFQPDLLIIDPLRRVHNLDENDSGQMSRLFNVFRQLATIPANTCGVLLVHHLRKRNEFDGDLDRLRGSSDIAASLDSILEVSGEFGMVRVRHAKSKRGPTQKTFIVQADVDSKFVRLVHVDQQEKAEADHENVRGFIMGLLSVGEVKQIDLWAQGKARGFGKERLKNVCAELLDEGRIEVKPGPRGSKIFHVAAVGAGVAAATSEEEERSVFAGPWKAPEKEEVEI